MKLKGQDIFIDGYLAKYDIVAFTIEYIRKEYKGEYIVNSDVAGKISVIVRTDTEKAITGKEKGEICEIWPHPLACYLWKQTGALFSFFVWCVSVECYKHGFNIFKSIDKKDLSGCVCDVQRFRYFFPVGYNLLDFTNNTTGQNIKTDRKIMQSIKQGYRPKGADKLEKIIQNTLQKFFITR